MTAKIVCNSVTFDLITFDYNFSRNVSGTGAPSGEILYGEVSFSYRSSDDPLIENATFHTFLSGTSTRHDATISLYDNGGNEKRTIVLKGAAIVTLSESYSAGKNGNISTISVTLCAPNITIKGNQIVNGPWT